MTEQKAGPRLLHPIFFALAAGCLVVADSSGPTLGVLDGLVLIAGGFLGAAITWLARRTVSTPARAGVLASIVVLFLTEYGSFLHALGIGGPLAWQVHWRVLATWVLVFVALAIAAWRTAQIPTTATRFLNAFGAVWLFFAVAAAAEPARDRLRQPPVALEVPAVTHAGAGVPPPDIYLIILDKYTASWALREYLGYDNRPFAESLRARGFTVPRRPRANYVHTFLALASLLNWTYLDTLGSLPGRDSRERDPVMALVRRNRAVATARARGYRVTFLPSTYGATTWMDGADEVLRTGANERLTLLLAAAGRTPLAPAFARVANAFPGTPGRFPYRSESAEQMERKFRWLGELPRSAGPKLVVAHLLVPHEPYVFNADCSPRPAFWPRSDLGENERIVRAAYTAQISCVNRHLMRLVDDILSQSHTPPVILLQADHGHGRIASDPWTGSTVPLAALPPEKVAARTSVFAAYYLPGDHPPVPDTMTPVNLLPLVFNTYLGTSIPMQPDRTFWSEWRQPYRFVHIP
jgi:hypothetical protein